MNNDAPEKQAAENRDERAGHGQFAPGNRGGPGRPKGLPNKVNALLKDDIAEAYRQHGGIDWLRSLKDLDFVRLLEKCIPRESSSSVALSGSMLSVNVNIHRYSPELPCHEPLDALPGGQENGFPDVQGDSNARGSNQPNEAR